MGRITPTADHGYVEATSNEDQVAWTAEPKETLIEPSQRNPFRETVEKIDLAVQALNAISVLLEHGAQIHASDEVFRVFITAAHGKAHAVIKGLLLEVVSEIEQELVSRGIPVDVYLSDMSDDSDGIG